MIDAIHNDSSILYTGKRIRSGLPLKLQIGAIDLTERKGHFRAIGKRDSHGLSRRIGAGDHAVKIFGRGGYHDFTQHHFDLFAHKTFPVLPLEQLALNTGRTDLQAVGTFNYVLGIENVPDFMLNQLAIAMVDSTFGPIDDEEKHLMTSRALEVDLDDFETFRLRDTFGDFFDLRCDSRSIHARFQ